MRKIDKRNIIMLVLIIIVIIIGIKFLANSKAKKENLVTAIIKDNNCLLSDVKYKIELNEDENGKFIILPEVVNEKVIKNYFIKEKRVRKREKNTNEIQNNIVEEEKNTNEIQNNIVEEEKNTNEIQNDIVEEERNTNEIQNNIVEEEKNTNEIQNNIVEEERNTNEIQSNIVEEEKNTNEIQNNIVEEEVKEDVQNSIEKKADNLQENIVTKEIDKKNNKNIKKSLKKETSEKNTDIIIKKPGEKVYLSGKQSKNKRINLKVEYETKENNGQVLYKKVLENTEEDRKKEEEKLKEQENNKNVIVNEEINNIGEKDNQNIEKNDTNEESEIEDKNKIIVQGFMPEKAEIKAIRIKDNEIEEKAKEYISKQTKIKVAYDIKIIVDGKEYEPSDFDENVEVIIVGVDTKETNNERYKIIHIKEDKENNKIETEEVKNIEIKENKVRFKARGFSTYALLAEPQTTNEGGQVPYTSKSAVIQTGSEWNGSEVSSQFVYGEGTQEKPYLIADGADLAYLRNQVNSGEKYLGKYFQLACDINLGNHNWTPIGDNDNSFQGIFDGAGHTIANAKIQISTIPQNKYVSFGLFGSIGGGNSKAIIRNLELSNINTVITANGKTNTSMWSSNTGGIHIGTLVGTAYKNSNIVNVICKSSSITDTNVISVSDSNFHLSVGGIVGYIANVPGNFEDPGANARYLIENCFSDVSIELDAKGEQTNSWFGQKDGRGHYHTGGIVGTISKQPVWPKNCLYMGNIRTNGFIGPIFAALVGNTAYTTSTGFPNLWNGNDAGGNLQANEIYYSNYTASGQQFTGTVTSGTSNLQVSTDANNIGYVQGVNKGIYTTDMTSVLNMFNSNVTATNKYVNWLYQNNTFIFKERLVTDVTENENFNYTINVTDPYNINNYTYEWYKNGNLDTSITGSQYSWTPNYDNDEEMVVITNDGSYYTVTKFIIQKIRVDIVFDIDEANASVTASLTGEGMRYTTEEAYTYQWYKYDISGEGGPIEGATSNELTNLEEGMDYKLIATNTQIPQLSTENSFTYGERIAVYVDYANGNDNNNGFTDQTPVKNMNVAYTKLSATGNRNINVIVVMGQYTESSYLNQENNSPYNKKATLTGKYRNIDYDGQIVLTSTNSAYKYLGEDTTFQNLVFQGNNQQLYLYLQGYSLTIGEKVTMENYANANANQGLIGSNAPAFHIICGWLQYNYATLPRNDAKIIIKSGTYGRIIGGGSPGTSDVNNLVQNTSHNFMGSSTTDSFRINITINIQRPTNTAGYDYDVNLLVGGSACGNNYSIVTENIKAGSVGRLLGGSIGDSSNKPNNWNYPINTFLGETNINISGGLVNELYGGCLGRNMLAIGGGWNPSTVICDSYFYGEVNINITGGVVNSNIYGAGAGGVTGYSENSSDPYKTYGQPFATSVNIDISGGTINGNIYGGGYGYTEYLTEDTTAEDGGALYGNSNITITGNPTLNGNIYGAGRGYNFGSKTELARMEGTTHIEISGNPTISGKIFGAGEGISGKEEMAKLTGNSNLIISSNLSTQAYGGGNISKVVGQTNVNINNGNHTADIYGGGDKGIIEGTTNVNINGGTSDKVFGGGNQAKVTKTIVNIKGGTTQDVFGGGNQASADETNVYLKGGTAINIYGGSNQSGDIPITKVETTSGTATNIYGGNNLGGSTNETIVTINGGSILDSVYGGGNQVETPTTNVELKSSTNVIPNVFGGGNNAGATTTNVIGNGGSATNVFGGSNMNGEVTNSNVTINNGNYENVYGGNNQGGKTLTTNVLISGTGATNVYGGGNQAITNVTNVVINGEVRGNLYGGGNQAGVETDTHLDIINGTVFQNAYGGGNQGPVTQNTFVHIKNSTLNSNVYAGGNGATAVVYGNTNLLIDGTTTVINESVFGGGNQAETGDINTQTSTSTVNIAGGRIGGNVYGGANTSVVNGNAVVNIGKDTINNTDLEVGDVFIEGTIFGGGEANASGDENYDFSFISVTQGINISINGNGHDRFEMFGSIFGSGNASSASGESIIDIKNYGTPENPQKNISLQRANLATISNSTIILSGATDRTNEYSNVYFSISRVDRVKLKNNSVLYLCNGANLLKNLDSLVDVGETEEKAKVTIDAETGEISERNVDNRIYMLETKNLNVAKNEQVTSYGQVSGMTFFGLFTNKNSPHTSTGLYDKVYNNGDTIINAGTFVSNSYVMAEHMENHDITIDGFYSNYDNEGTIKVKYVKTTPQHDVYYIWLVGEEIDVTVFNLTLNASKYATLGTCELLLKGFSTPNIEFSIIGFSAGLADGVFLDNPATIQKIEQDEDIANNKFGITMKTGHIGWETNGKTNFLTQNGVTYAGTNDYKKNNSQYTPTLNFCLYHSENITLARDLGSITIRLQALTPIDDLNYALSYIDINIGLSSALYQTVFYEAAITPGQQFDLFTSTETTITNKSAFSTYFSLYIDNFSESDYYENYNNLHRVLVSLDENNNPYTFPENTKITMLDMSTNQYYYYIVTAEDVAQTKYMYNISDFILMGSEDGEFNELEHSQQYYNAEENLIYENFIFHINFADTNITNNIINNSLLLELQDSENNTLLGVLGIQRDVMRYSVYNNEATIELNGNLKKDVIYLGEDINLNINTTFTQSIVNTTTVYDTHFFDKKLGAKISIYDENGNRLNNDSLLGINFELNGRLYYPKIDGTTRIKLADKVTDVLSKVKIHTEDNKTLATGMYKIRIESFGSADGIYYGLTASDMIELDLQIINSSYGIKATTNVDAKIVDKDTGLDNSGNNNIETQIQYSSSLTNPIITVSLYRRDYQDIFLQNYNLVNLEDYVTNTLEQSGHNLEYLVTDNPLAEFTTSVQLKPNLLTGTYKFVYKLYDGNNYVGETYEYIIIK